MEHSVASAMANLITLITESDPEGAYYDMLDYDKAIVDKYREAEWQDYSRWS